SPLRHRRSKQLTDHRLRLRAGDLHGLPHCSLNSDLDGSRISGASSVHVDRCTAERMVRNDGAHRLRRDDLGAALADEIRSTWIDRTARRTSPTEAEEARNAADRTAERAEQVEQLVQGGIRDHAAQHVIPSDLDSGHGVDERIAEAAAEALPHVLERLVHSLDGISNAVQRLLGDQSLGEELLSAAPRLGVPFRLGAELLRELLGFPQLVDEDRELWTQVLPGAKARRVQFGDEVIEEPSVFLADLLRGPF